MATPPDQIIESPCNSTCTLSPASVCMGCFRSLQEIIRWARASEKERRAILARAEERQKGKKTA